MADAVPWMRLWVAQLSADTQHLTAAQLGSHLRLLMMAWRRTSCSIPNDADWICRRLGIGPDYYAQDVAPVLADLWESDGEDLHNLDQRKERLHVEQRSEQARQAALIRHHGQNVHPLKTREKR
jgi:uncharacterized protein YdaU (DUF1376 family)